MLRCIIFDLGDTLVDTSSALKAAQRSFYLPFLKKHGYKISINKIDDAFDEVLKEVPDYYNRKEINRMVLKKLGIRSDDEFLNEWSHGYHKEYISNLKLLGRAREVLEFCSKQIYMVLVSNGRKETIYEILRKFDIERYFDMILTSEEFDAKSSLNPFKFIIKQLPFNPREFLMVGDRLDEDAHARRVGMKVVWIQHSRARKREYHKETEDYDWKITRLDELEKIVVSLL